MNPPKANNFLFLATSLCRQPSTMLGIGAYELSTWSYASTVFTTRFPPKFDPPTTTVLPSNGVHDAFLFTTLIPKNCLHVQLEMLNCASVSNEPTEDEDAVHKQTSAKLSFVTIYDLPLTRCGCRKVEFAFYAENMEKASFLFRSQKRVGNEKVFRINVVHVSESIALLPLQLPPTIMSKSPCRQHLFVVLKSVKSDSPLYIIIFMTMVLHSKISDQSFMLKMWLNF